MAKALNEAAVRPLDDELAEALRAELLTWPGVAPRSMFGTLSFFRGKQMLGCYVSRDLIKKSPKPPWVNRPGEPPIVWIRLRRDDAERALARPGVRPDWWARTQQPVRESRLGFAGWVEVPLDSRAALAEAVRWLGTAYERPPRSAPKRKPRSAAPRRKTNRKRRKGR
jgi:hypothetical protein